MFDVLMKTLLGCVFLSLFAAASLPMDRKPLLRKRCRDCGAKNRDWRIVPTGGDEFAWEHHCKEK